MIMHSALIHGYIGSLKNGVIQNLGNIKNINKAQETLIQDFEVFNLDSNNYREEFCNILFKNEKGLHDLSGSITPKMKPIESKNGKLLPSDTESYLNKLVYSNGTSAILKETKSKLKSQTDLNEACQQEKIRRFSIFNTLAIETINDLIDIKDKISPKTRAQCLKITYLLIHLESIIKYEHHMNLRQATKRHHFWVEPAYAQFALIRPVFCALHLMKHDYSIHYCKMINGDYRVSTKADQKHLKKIFEINHVFDALDENQFPTRFTLVSQFNINLFPYYSADDAFEMTSQNSLFESVDSSDDVSQEDHTSLLQNSTHFSTKARLFLIKNKKALYVAGLLMLVGLIYSLVETHVFEKLQKIYM
jgi:hypothetical protein